MKFNIADVSSQIFDTELLHQGKKNSPSKNIPDIVIQPPSGRRNKLKLYGSMDDGEYLEDKELKVKMSKRKRRISMRNPQLNLSPKK
jgi:hypothetical protein